MNIFKVLASGKKSFQEETASAILAWFMNPSMEHGLGFSLLSKFVNGLSVTNKIEPISELSNKLVPRLRSEPETQVQLSCSLEYNVETAFIDIVFGLDDWLLAIEKKIYVKSVSDGQLSRQYKGLKKRNPGNKIGMIYVVPIEEDAEILEPKSEQIFNELSVIDDDFKAIVTWQRNKIENTLSMHDVITEILQDEMVGRTDPIPEYTRHTLKALNAFIANNFAGYDYERADTASGVNPLTEEQLSIDRLAHKNAGYVGVKGGIRGLLKMETTKIRTHRFQYSSQDMSDKPQWIEIETFNKIVAWISTGNVADIAWRGRLHADSLYRVAKDFGNKVFIGIKGGQNALRAMPPEEIRSREWNISTERSNPQWISGALFVEIVDGKGVY
jgi:hypothetical protein